MQQMNEAAATIEIKASMDVETTFLKRASLTVPLEGETRTVVLALQRPAALRTR